MNFSKKLLAGAVVAGLSTTTATSILADEEADFYGRVDIGLSVADDGTQTVVDLEGENSRLGVKGTHGISPGLSAFYRFEFRILGDTTNIQPNNRKSYVGLQSDIGALSVGRQSSAMENTIGGFIDPTEIVGTNDPTSSRLSELIKFHGEAGNLWYEFDVQVLASTPEEDFDRYQAAFRYESGALKIGGGYDQLSGTPDDTKQIGIGGAFKLSDAVTLQGGITTTDDGSTDDTVYLNLNADISAGDGLSFLVGAASESDDDGSGTGGDGDSRTDIFAGVYKRLDKQTRVYLEAVSISPDVGEDRSRYVASIRHDF